MYGLRGPPAHHHHATHVKVRRREALLPSWKSESDPELDPTASSPAGVPVNNILMPREQLPRAAASNDFTCGPGRPCENEACCGSSGWCGYESKYCGKGCQSNCDATAECGKYSDPPGLECPLNVCCSEFGFCGTTTEFCKDGCQSNCKQPKPSVSKSDVQKKIIAYWEGWNENKPCGHMRPNEIPVYDITHLIFSFGFITPGDFRITNMPDVRPELFEEVTMLKNRNPDLQVLIALGGWTHNDPGKWQTVFSDLASTEANRQKFITNLLGFLNQYGFDGVDFDWEYPGADDRGGQDGDSKNYVKLLKELRAAIRSRGQSYLITYTAPSSYWYLKHFDINGMSSHVDWINLMSYDLHGIWDRDNPIGNKILGHTNLTEIDLALDLFWRNGISPSDLVLGIGFYGRSFKLSDPTCWKPGCRFKDPGDKGECTDTAGFLSYQEIMDIVKSSGVKPTYDEEAKVNYMVYGQNNWISYDDKNTFSDKVDFANERGLSGLMIWAIDLDDTKHSALSALTGKGVLDSDNFLNMGRHQALCCDAPGGTKQLSSPVDLDKIFPPEYLPPADALPRFELVNFGGIQKESDPNETGFAFFLIAGSNTVVSSMSKRDNPGIQFLGCPKEILDVPLEQIQTARVICMHGSLDDCFGVQKNGVEGTIVKMPEECGRSTYARAVSLTPSQDQNVPVELALEGPVSAVYDFSFDYNLGLVRRDAGKLSIRMDYSNVKGYWNAVVDSNGKSKRHLQDIVTRFFSDNRDDWSHKFQTISVSRDDDLGNVPKRDLTKLISYEGQMCSANDGPEGQAIAVAIEGEVDATLFYGFSMIATWDPAGKVEIHQSAGFIDVDGETDAFFTVAGIGTLDASSKRDKVLRHTDRKNTISGHSVYHGWASFTAYSEQSVFFSTEGDDEEVQFNGFMQAKVKAYWGGGSKIIFPPEDSTSKPRELSLGSKNRMTPMEEGKKSKITVTNSFRLGLDVALEFPSGYKSAVAGELPDMSVSQALTASFSFEDSGNEICVETSMIQSHQAVVEDGVYAGWGSDSDTLFTRKVKVSEKECFSKTDSEVGDSDKRSERTKERESRSHKNRKRQKNNSVPGDYAGLVDIPKVRALIESDATKEEWSNPICDACGGCYLTKQDLRRDCCECAWILPEYGDGDTGAAGLVSVDEPGVGTDDDIGGIGCKKYFHNSTSSCTSFDVSQFASWDVMYPYPKQNAKNFVYQRGVPYHGLYDTEHVFEGQTIGRFFDTWLFNSAQKTRAHYWVEENFFTSNSKWGKSPLMKLLVDELGTIKNQNRLTLFMSMPNQHKGRLFRGFDAVGLTKFKKLAKGADQLLEARYIGMIFPYLNHDEVWESFCETYNAISVRLQDFDTWYEEETGAESNLADEWAKFVRSDLDMVVNKARTNLKMLYDKKKWAGAQYKILWDSMMESSGDMRKVKLERTDYCKGLPATGIPDPNQRILARTRSDLRLAIPT
ncbi:hypothetical protein G7Z17_g2800 [Cylindrodendrum hubeiense]|uniref:chitinase n=1 Tax=Cylindrodendrum hubeiense TaxID=595255 RepID=A0A9P5HFV0_9HYPO|nr:hypothetical protein G7Z17_g2800 [Cylindrodendrum hubeiense]